MTRLTAHAKQALDILAEKHLALTVAKAMIEAELKNELNERLHSFKNERDIALRLADQAGVPRTQLGKAIGTTNYRTVQEILEVTEVATHSETSADGKWSITTLPNGSYSLNIEGMGVGSVSGTAVVNIVDDGTDLEFVEGDAFVIPQIYRNGYLEQVILSVK
jgi:hypothetical protein